MKIEDIKILLDVIKQKSFTEAGIINEYSQSTISKKIKKIEEELKIKLVYRNKNAEILPTTQEQKIHDDLNMIIETYEKIKNMTNNKIIKIGFSTGYSETKIIEIIEKLKKENIETQVEIVNSEQLYRDILENKIDVAIIGIKKENEKIYTEKITEEQIILAGKKPIKYFDKEKIYEIPLILHQEGSGLREFIIEKLEQMKIKTNRLQIKYEIGYEEFSIEAAKKGYGYIFIPKEKCQLPLQKIWEPEELTRSFYIISKDKQIIKKIKE